MGRFMDLTGERFGRLTVLYSVDTTRNATLWHCRCDCGVEKNVTAGKLRSGNTRSCGCLRRELLTESNRKHDMSHTRLYDIWQNMKRRCDDAKNPKYKNYGARGIKVCDEWYDSKVFFEWALANGYRDDLTIDRIDVNQGYSPQNCRWADKATQSLNRTDNRYLTYNGKTQTIKEWSDEFNIPYKVLYSRVSRYGWSVERALGYDL